MTCGPPSPCAACGETAPVCGRGLCRTCYDCAYERGEHIDFPRRTRRAEDVVQDLRELQMQGCAKDEIAARMGLKWDSITRAALRLRQRSRA